MRKKATKKHSLKTQNLKVSGHKILFSLFSFFPFFSPLIQNTHNTVERKKRKKEKREIREKRKKVLLYYIASYLNPYPNFHLFTKLCFLFCYTQLSISQEVCKCL